MPSEPSLHSLVQFRKTGVEPFRSAATAPTFPLIEFWQWSASDLISNATRGRLAEFLVAKALGLADGIRAEWDPFDLQMPSGLKIEVKSCAYLQSWHQVKLSNITFNVRETRAWAAQTGAMEEIAKRQADVYVFALLAHTDKATVDALDLDQWHFYVVPTSHLNERKQASITLRAIQTLCPESMSWAMLADAIQRLTERIVKDTTSVVP